MPQWFQISQLVAGGVAVVGLSFQVFKDKSVPLPEAGICLAAIIVTTISLLQGRPTGALIALAVVWVINGRTLSRKMKAKRRG